MSPSASKVEPTKWISRRQLIQRHILNAIGTSRRPRGCGKTTETRLSLGRQRARTSVGFHPGQIFSSHRPVEGFPVDPPSIGGVREVGCVNRKQIFFTGTSARLKKRAVAFKKDFQF